MLVSRSFPKAGTKEGIWTLGQYNNNIGQKVSYAMINSAPALTPLPPPPLPPSYHTASLGSDVLQRSEWRSDSRPIRLCFHRPKAHAVGVCSPLTFFVCSKISVIQLQTKLLVASVPYCDVSNKTSCVVSGVGMYHRVLGFRCASHRTCPGRWALSLLIIAMVNYNSTWHSSSGRDLVMASWGGVLRSGDDLCYEIGPTLVFTVPRH